MRFRVNLNGFSEITKENPKWPGKKIRFNVVWWLENSDGERVYWLEMRGCLASLTERGDLIWTPPMAGMRGYKYCVIEVNDALSREVAEKIRNSKWMGILQEPNFVDLKDVTV